MLNSNQSLVSRAMPFKLLMIGSYFRIRWVSVVTPTLEWLTLYYILFAVIYARETSAIYLLPTIFETYAVLIDTRNTCDDTTTNLFDTFSRIILWYWLLAILINIHSILKDTCDVNWYLITFIDFFIRYTFKNNSIIPNTCNTCNWVCQFSFLSLLERMIQILSSILAIQYRNFLSQYILMITCDVFTSILCKNKKKTVEGKSKEYPRRLKLNQLLVTVLNEETDVFFLHNHLFYTHFHMQFMWYIAVIIVMAAPQWTIFTMRSPSDLNIYISLFFSYLRLLNPSYRPTSFYLRGGTKFNVTF